VRNLTHCCDAAACIFDFDVAAEATSERHSVGLAERIR
jgi:hypothetical protein